MTTSTHVTLAVKPRSLQIHPASKGGSLWGLCSTLRRGRGDSDLLHHVQSAMSTKAIPKKVWTREGMLVWNLAYRTTRSSWQRRALRKVARRRVEGNKRVPPRRQLCLHKIATFPSALPQEGALQCQRRPPAQHRGLHGRDGRIPQLEEPTLQLLLMSKAVEAIPSASTLESSQRRMSFQRGREQIVAEMAKDGKVRAISRPAACTARFTEPPWIPRVVTGYWLLRACSYEWTLRPASSYRGSGLPWRASRGMRRGLLGAEPALAAGARLCLRGCTRVGWRSTCAQSGGCRHCQSLRRGTSQCQWVSSATQSCPSPMWPPWSASSCVSLVVKGRTSSEAKPCLLLGAAQHWARGTQRSSAPCLRWTIPVGSSAC